MQRNGLGTRRAACFVVLTVIICWQTCTCQSTATSEANSVTTVTSEANSVTTVTNEANSVTTVPSETIDTTIIPIPETTEGVITVGLSLLQCEYPTDQPKAQDKCASTLNVERKQYVKSNQSDGEPCLVYACPPNSLYTGKCCFNQNWIIGFAAGIGGIIICVLCIVICVLCCSKPPAAAAAKKDDDLGLAEMDITQTNGPPDLVRNGVGGLDLVGMAEANINSMEPGDVSRPEEVFTDLQETERPAAPYRGPESYPSDRRPPPTPPPGRRPVDDDRGGYDNRYEDERRNPPPAGRPDDYDKRYSDGNREDLHVRYDDEVGYPEDRRDDRRDEPTSKYDRRPTSRYPPGRADEPRRGEGRDDDQRLDSPYPARRGYDNRGFDQDDRDEPRNQTFDEKRRYIEEKTLSDITRSSAYKNFEPQLDRLDSRPMDPIRRPVIRSNQDPTARADTREQHTSRNSYGQGVYDDVVVRQ